MAPELSALIVIFLSVGPVISTRRSCRALGAAATFQEESSRTDFVSSRNLRSSPAAILAMRWVRAARSSKRRELKLRWSKAISSRDVSVKIVSEPATAGPETMTPATLINLNQPT